MTEEEDRNSERRARSEGAGRDETRHKDVSRCGVVFCLVQVWTGKAKEMGRGAVSCVWFWFRFRVSPSGRQVRADAFVMTID